MSTPSTAPMNTPMPDNHNTPPSKKLLDIPELLSRGVTWGAMLGLYTFAVLALGWAQDTGIETLTVRFEAIGQRVGRVEQRMDRLEASLVTMRQELSTVHTEVATMRAVMDANFKLADERMAAGFKRQDENMAALREMLRDKKR
jgi:hypothetical protein